MADIKKFPDLGKLKKKVGGSKGPGTGEVRILRATRSGMQKSNRKAGELNISLRDMHDLIVEMKRSINTIVRRVHNVTRHADYFHKSTFEGWLKSPTRKSCLLEEGGVQFSRSQILRAQALGVDINGKAIKVADEELRDGLRGLIETYRLLSELQKLVGLEKNDLRAIQQLDRKIEEEIISVYRILQDDKEDLPIRIEAELIQDFTQENWRIQQMDKINDQITAIIRQIALNLHQVNVSLSSKEIVVLFLNFEQYRQATTQDVHQLCVYLAKSLEKNQTLSQEIFTKETDELRAAEQHYSDALRSQT